jgi:phosphoribosylamine--glycine ligase
MANGAKNFLFVSKIALAGDLAWQVRKEGHKVKFSASDKDSKDIYDGFVDKADDWKEHVDWADVIVFDDVEGFGAEAEKLRKHGKLVVGGTAYTDRLEDDKGFGQEEMKAAGITTIPNWMFTDFDEAAKFIKKNPDRYVLKPSGSAQTEKELLFIGQEEDGKDVVQVLEHYRKTWAKFIKEFQLQKFVSGVEVAVGAFFNGKEFIYPINVNFEHKRLFPGEVGPQTGEMGTVLYWSPPNKIFMETLERMAPKLRQAGYVGYADINCIVNAKGVYPLEFTMRFGYPHLSIAMEGILSPWGEFLRGIAAGEKPELKAKRGFQVGVVVAVPPFPYNDKQAFKRFSEGAVVLFKKEAKEGFPEGVHIGDVKLAEGDWVLTGTMGYALVVTGSGSTVEDARKMAYNRVRNIMIPNMFYREDIGERLREDLDRLMTWGYIY